MQKQINEIIEALNKCQTETETTINREINELRSKIDNIKGKVTHIWKTSQKRMKQKYKTKWKAIPANRTNRRQNLRT
jgi:paraquat-inducible protein B